METVEVRTDDQNQYSWDIIRSTFVDGVLSDRQITYDNGTFAQTSYMGGIRFLMSQRDSILNGGAKTWDTIDTYYAPDGSIAGRVTVFDNGVLKEETFNNGVRSQTVQMDNPQNVSGNGVKSWDSITTYYDSAGKLAGRITQYDNGIFKEESFENGVRSQTRQIDNPQTVDGSSGAKSWDEINSYYDASGVLVGRLTQYDNGVFKEESFENGVRSHTRQFDNPLDLGGTGVKAWDTIDQYYDESGQIVARIISIFPMMKTEMWPRRSRFMMTDVYVKTIMLMASRQALSSKIGSSIMAATMAGTFCSSATTLTAPLRPVKSLMIMVTLCSRLIWVAISLKSQSLTATGARLGRVGA